MVAHLDPRSLEDLVWTWGKLHPSYHDLPYVRQVLYDALPRLAEPGLLAGMSPLGLSMVVYGMGKAGVPYEDEHVRRAVCAAVRAAAAAGQGCSPQAVGNLAWGLSRSALAQQGPGVLGGPAGEAAGPVGVAGPGARLAQRPERAAVPPAAEQAPGGASTHPDVLSALDALASAATSAAEYGQLDRYKPQELTNLLGALATHGSLPAHSQLLAASAAYCSRRLGDMGPQDVAELLYAYGTVRQQQAGTAPMLEHAEGGQADLEAGAGARGGAASYLGEELLGMLEARCLALLPRTPAYQAATMLWALVHLGHQPQQLLGAVVDALGAPAPARLQPQRDAAAAAASGPREQQPRHGRQSAAHTAAADGAAARKAGASSSSSSDATSTAPRAGWGVTDLADQRSMPPEHMARMLWALGRLGAQLPPAALAGVCDAVEGRLTEFDTQSLLLVSWSLAALRCPHHSLVEALASRLTRLLPRLAPEQLALALWATARQLEAGGRTLHGMACITLFTASGDALLRALPRLGPRGVAMAAWAYSVVQVHPGDRALEALWMRAEAALPGMSGQGLVMVGSALAHFRGDREGQVAAALAAAAGGRVRGTAAAAAAAGAGQPVVSARQRLLHGLLAAAARRMAGAVRRAEAGATSAEHPAPPAPSRLAAVPPPAAPVPSNAAAAGGGAQEVLLGPAGAVWASNMVGCLGRLGLRSNRFLALACEHAAHVLPHCTAREAVPLLWGLGELARGAGARGEAERSASGSGAAVGVDEAEGRCPPALVQQLVAVVERAVREDAAARLQGRRGAGSNTAVSTRATSQGRQELVLQQFQQGAPQAQAQQEQEHHAPGAPSAPLQLDGGLLTMFLLACVSHRHQPSPPVLQAACCLLLPHAQGLAARTLCELAWALAYLQPSPQGGLGAATVLPMVLAQADGLPAASPGVQAAAGEGMGPTTVLGGVPGAAAAALGAAGRGVGAAGVGVGEGKGEGRPEGVAQRPGAAGAGAAARSQDVLSQLVQAAWRAAQRGKRRQAVAARRGAVRAKARAAQRKAAGVLAAAAGGADAGGEAARARAGAQVAATGEAAQPGGSAAGKGGVAVATVGRRLGRNGSGATPSTAEPAPTPALAPAGVAAGPMAAGEQGGELPSPPIVLRLHRSAPPMQLRTPTRARAARIYAAAASRLRAPPPAPASPAPDAGAEQAALQAPLAPLAPPASTAARGRKQRSPVSPPLAGSSPAAAPHVPPPTPRASAVAPIYPPAASLPASWRGCRLLLQRLLGLLRRRVCVERSELLSLESVVKAVWAMCVTRMYTPRLFRYCAYRAMASNSASLAGRPALLRALVDVRSLLARERPSTWRRMGLGRAWRRGLQRGAVWSVRREEVLQAQPPSQVRRLQRCCASLDAAAEANELPLQWRTTFQGDRHAVLWLGKRTACAIVLLAPWQLAATVGGHGAQGTQGSVGALALAPAAVAVRQLHLRGWLVAAVHVDAWLALGQRERELQVRVLAGRMREAARQRGVLAAEAGRGAAVGGWESE